MAERQMQLTAYELQQCLANGLTGLARPVKSSVLRRIASGTASGEKLTCPFGRAGDTVLVVAKPPGESPRLTEHRLEIMSTRLVRLEDGLLQWHIVVRLLP